MYCQLKTDLFNNWPEIFCSIQEDQLSCNKSECLDQVKSHNYMVKLLND